MPETTPTESLLDALTQITGTGTFCSAGERDFVFPQLTLTGGEELSFPLPASQVATIEAAGETAPYGKGEQTVRDESIRRCRQVDAADFSIGNPQWEEMIAGVAQDIAADLGVEGKVRATPYKLLLYSKGGHFKPHRDTEKLGAMFGTLIVALPSKHSGGELRVRHAGEEKKVSFSGPSGLQKVQYAAFFADCEHEVRPVTTGHRLCLAYNLTRPKSRKTPLNRPPEELSTALSAPLQELARQDTGDLHVVLLEHRYTESAFSLTALKGADRPRAQALFAAGEEAGLKAHLALVSLHQIGQLEEEWDSYGRNQSDEEEENSSTMGDLIEESLTLSHWRKPTGNAARMGDFSICPSLLISAGTLGESEPDEQFAEGYTGNAGCTLEHWYRRAGVVLWRSKDADRIAARYRFADTAAKWQRRAKTKATARSAAFISLGEALLEHAAVEVTRYSGGGLRLNGEIFSALVRTVAGTRNPQLMAQAEAVLLPALVPHTDVPTLKALVGAYGTQRIVDLATAGSADTEKVETGHQVAWKAEQRRAERTALRFRLLSALLRTRPVDEPAARALAATLAEALREEQAAPNYHRRSDNDVAERTHIALGASYLIEKKQQRTDLQRALIGDGLSKRVREVLAPALLQKTHRRHFDQPGSLAGQALEHCRTVLEVEAAQTIGPFPDWRRPGPPDDQSADTPTRWRAVRHGQESAIAKFNRFLEDPEAETARFPLRAELRESLQALIDCHQLDVHYRVEKTGSPHHLVCTKTDASLTRARQQQKDDAKLLTKLVCSETGAP